MSTCSPVACPNVPVCAFSRAGPASRPFHVSGVMWTSGQPWEVGVVLLCCPGRHEPSRLGGLPPVCPQPRAPRSHPAGAHTIACPVGLPTAPSMGTGLSGRAREQPRGAPRGHVAGLGRTTSTTWLFLPRVRRRAWLWLDCEPGAACHQPGCREEPPSPGLWRRLLYLGFLSLNI